MTDTESRASIDPAAAPDRRISPAVGSRRPPAMRSNVVFPEPLWPTSMTRSPTSMRRSSGANATRSPYSLVSSWVTSASVTVDLPGGALGPLGPGPLDASLHPGLRFLLRRLDHVPLAGHAHLLLPPGPGPFPHPQVDQRH